jgi:hypothetical protein
MAERVLGPSGGKRRRSMRWLLPLVVLLITLSVSVFTQAGGAVLSLSNPPPFTFVNDENGADDQPGQKDLSAQAVAVPAPGDLWVAWKWDVTSLSGGNTGDACALFDTNTNSKVNFAICVTIAGSPAAQSGVSPRVYTCGDGKVDRCTSTYTQVTPINSACATNTTASDPFHSGQFDTLAYCHVDLADVGGSTTANLVNTCSYPSQQPTSDPSDCVLIPRDAFIRISKTADAAGSFPFNLDGTSAYTPTFTASGTQTSSYIAITSGSTHPHSVQELVPTGWSITGTPSCTGASGNNGTYSGTTKTISGIVASSDNQITCSFTDQQQKATLDVSKTSSDNNSTAQNGAVFSLYSGATAGGTAIATCTVSAGHCGPNTPSFSNLAPGAYSLDETAVPTGYTKPSSLPDENFSLSAGQAVTLSFQDSAQPGSVQISKLDDKGNGVAGATFTLYQPATGTADPPTGTAVTNGSCITDGTGGCTISNLPSGSYTIDETPPTGYAKDASFPQDITVSRGTATNVSATDAKLFKVIVLVCQKTDDSLYASKVSFDGAALPGSNNSPTSVATGIDETKLCQLSGTYVHDDAQRNHNHTATIQIP